MPKATKAGKRQRKEAFRNETSRVPERFLAFCFERQIRKVREFLASYFVWKNFVESRRKGKCCVVKKGFLLKFS